MKQQTLAIATGQAESFERDRRPTRRNEFLATMDRIVPWAERDEVIGWVLRCSPGLGRCCRPRT